MEDFNFDPTTGLIPAIVQDSKTLKVLMLGYMNPESIAETRRTGKVTFFSRSKKRLWVKGESSGNFLWFKEMKNDCDRDALLILADPAGPVCHLGTDTCWKEENMGHPLNFLTDLEETIEQRRVNPAPGSYTSKLFSSGINKIAQKLGEEAVELVIESKDENKSLFIGEAADLIYHFLVLLRQKDVRLSDIAGELKERSGK